MKKILIPTLATAAIAPAIITSVSSCGKTVTINLDECTGYAGKDAYIYSDEIAFDKNTTYKFIVDYSIWNCDDDPNCLFYFGRHPEAETGDSFYGFDQNPSITFNGKKLEQGTENGDKKDFYLTITSAHVSIKMSDEITDEVRSSLSSKDVIFEITSKVKCDNFDWKIKNVLRAN